MQLRAEQAGAAVNHGDHIQLRPQLLACLQAERTRVQTKQDALAAAAFVGEPVEHGEAVTELVAPAVHLHRPRPGDLLPVLVDPAAAGERALVQLPGRYAVACGNLLPQVRDGRRGRGS